MSTRKHKTKLKPAIDLCDAKTNILLSKTYPTNSQSLVKLRVATMKTVVNHSLERQEGSYQHCCQLQTYFDLVALLEMYANTDLQTITCRTLVGKVTKFKKGLVVLRTILNSSNPPCAFCSESLRCKQQELRKHSETGEVHSLYATHFNPPSSDGNVLRPLIQDTVSETTPPLQSSS